MGQWQIELREKCNLNWPIYDGSRLRWAKSAAPHRERAVDRARWFEEPAVIASSQLARRKDRAEDLLASATNWDLIVLDEAHHARRKASYAKSGDQPNLLLRLMRRLAGRTRGLLLLTATPMQMDPVEVWDLLSLLGLPPEWTESEFARFFESAATEPISAENLEHMARLFRAVEARDGKTSKAHAARVMRRTPLAAKRLLRALRGRAKTPRLTLGPKDRAAAVRLMAANTPVRRLVSRHTRALLRGYRKSGRLAGRIADRAVRDRFLALSADESAVYEALRRYVRRAWNRADSRTRGAVGFVLSIYCRRAASSFPALVKTLERHLELVTARNRGSDPALAEFHAEDLSDDETRERDREPVDAAADEQTGLAGAEEAAVRELLNEVRGLPPDTKLAHLRTLLVSLRGSGYRKVMVFTQYTDTLDFLRDALGPDYGSRLLCYSGRGGELPEANGSWRRVSRAEARRHFRDSGAELLLCTDAAAEGLNFQFCGAVVNYDMPWNPMRVEQRIGRVDRIGQRHDVIRVVNLHYEGTVEADVYRALRERIGLFESVVGPLQPILASLPGRISDALVAEDGARVREKIVADVKRKRASGFDLDQTVAADLDMPERPPSPVALADLDRLLREPALLPPGVVARQLQGREYEYRAPGLPRSVRVTTDPAFFAEHPDSVELWSPGSPLFPEPGERPGGASEPAGTTLSSLLDRHPGR